MMKILQVFLVIGLLSLSLSSHAQNAGYFAGGFADGLSKGMSSADNAAAISQAITQQRIENRRQYGTREILRMNALEVDADKRLREIFKELNDPQYKGGRN